MVCKVKDLIFQYDKSIINIDYQKITVGYATRHTAETFNINIRNTIRRYPKKYNDLNHQSAANINFSRIGELQ